MPRLRREKSRAAEKIAPSHVTRKSPRGRCVSSNTRAYRTAYDFLYSHNPAAVCRSAAPLGVTVVFVKLQRAFKSARAAVIKTKTRLCSIQYFLWRAVILLSSPPPRATREPNKTTGTRGFLPLGQLDGARGSLFIFFFFFKREPLQQRAAAGKKWG